MRKIFSWAKENLLFLFTLFLLIFIPLYPKIPLFDITNTWVYVRVEDFAVLLAILFWLSLLFRKKVTLKTPLTIPIMLFWVAGAISTIHGVVLFFPGLANVFPNVALLSFLRHIEYLGLFFVAYSSIKNKNQLNYVFFAIALTLFLVFAYGIGQKYLGFPAFLTMNEEFAKGVPIQLSSLSRVPSTFAGHYDLAAYLVLTIPIIVSLIFGYKNLIVKIILLILSFLGTILLFMTVSRVSFLVLFVSIFVVLIFQKKKIILYVLPLIFLSGVVIFLLKPTLLNRFNSTVKEVDVLVDAKTGGAIGEVKFTDSAYLKDKIIEQAKTRDKEDVDLVMTGVIDELKIPQNPLIKTPLIFPKEIPLVRATNISTGESLPQGTGYINLALSPVKKRLSNFYYELSPNLISSNSAEVIIVYGDFLVKRAAAYDLSFTTRFQGEWPRTIDAFKNNIFFGSGYGSVSLAVDNNYLRMLGETGLLGTAAFFAIFIAIGISIKNTWKEINSRKSRSFIIGFIAGVIGLGLNATLIDVFEASKIAFLLWILTGIVVGELSLYSMREVNIYNAFKKVALSWYAIVAYILIITLAIFSPIINNFFVGDDFTWLRWVAECTGKCPSFAERVFQFFTDSQGFFYRPGTKVFFTVMYSLFWLNPVAYHIFSLLLHFLVVSLLFLLARKIFKSSILAGISSLIFLVLSGYAEVIFWISSIGYLFTALFALLSILSFIQWIEKKQTIFYIFSLIFMILGLLFHEVGVVIPFYLILYKLTLDEKLDIKSIIKIPYLSLFAPIPVYFFARVFAQSHWFAGDYNYNLLKLPFNFIGNFIGYLFVVVLGPLSMILYEKFRSFSKENAIIASIVILVITILFVLLYKVFRNKISSENKKIIFFGISFSLISLLPFLGLGNITSRYSYLASFGFVVILTLIIKETFHYLKNYGKDIAILSTVILMAMFSLLHIIQFQQMQNDWRTAGNRSKEFFVAIDELYSSSWSENSIGLHFVNVPIRIGEAWIFPVGLNDAIWFAFRNSNMKIYTYSDVKTALDTVGYSITDKIFEFKEDGSLKEIPVKRKILK